jgi:hypothetical protein
MVERLQLDCARQRLFRLTRVVLRSIKICLKIREGYMFDMRFRNTLDLWVFVFIVSRKMQ